MISGSAIHKELNKANEKKVQNVQVFVRVRPLSLLELASKEALPLDWSTDKDLVCNYKGISRTYQFDHIFPPDSKQQDLFEVSVRPIADEVLSGFNGTIFVYGQTGTGKTYTMEGKMDQPEENGIIPRTVDYIFQTLEKAGNDYNVRCSHLEIYKEEIYDLLTCNNQNENKALNVYDGKVQDLEEVVVNDTKSILSVLSKSCKRRQTAETQYNKHSSRSHCIFTITVNVKETTLGGEDLIKIGKLNLVDLAGSENAQKSGTSERLREAAVINQSLLTLGRVITALTSEGQGHIPYRDSKLTRLLQDSLGGKTKTSIIATVSPSALNLEETVNTLDYALKAKSIKNTPTINQRMSKNSLLKEQSAEIARLKQLLQSAYDKNGVYLSKDVYHDMEAKIESQRELIESQELQLHAEKTELELLKKQLATQITMGTRVEKELTRLKRDQQEHLENCKSDDTNLRATLSSAVDDLHAMHSKLDAAKTVELENAMALESAKMQLESTVSEMLASSREAASTNVQFLDTLKEHFAKLQDLQAHDNDGVARQLEDMCQLIALSYGTLSNISDSLQNTNVPMSKITFEVDTLATALDKAVGDLKIVASTTITGLGARFAKHTERMALEIEKCIAMVDQGLADTSTQEDAQQQQHKNIDRITQLIDQYIQDRTQFIEVQREEQSKLSAKRQEQRAAAERKFTAKLTQFITQHCSKMNEEFEESDQRLTEQLNHFASDFDGVSEQLHASIQAAKQVSMDNSTGQLSTLMAHEVKAHLQTLGTELTSQQDGDLDSDVKESNQRLDKACKKHLSATAKIKGQLAGRVTSALTVINQSLNDQQTIIDELRSAEKSAKAITPAMAKSTDRLMGYLGSSNELIDKQYQSAMNILEGATSDNKCNIINQIPKLLKTKSTLLSSINSSPFVQNSPFMFSAGTIGSTARNSLIQHTTPSKVAATTTTTTTTTTSTTNSPLVGQSTTTGSPFKPLKRKNMTSSRPPSALRNHTTSSKLDESSETGSIDLSPKSSQPLKRVKVSPVASSNTTSVTSRKPLVSSTSQLVPPPSTTSSSSSTSAAAAAPNSSVAKRTTSGGATVIKKKSLSVATSGSRTTKSGPSGGKVSISSGKTKISSKDKENTMFLSNFTFGPAK
ncbi:hypothetical protein SAMD00019534_078440 [Acytostelium subglobosum LB1]|uniref:hypothetical protein n=1 Tax=Acytostelium subglobosum LB1 TaxID=1410327 RepID=UPI000644F669|nr:hypothetical protein SAMD00019534_078440 [Acytostelium subglobosum LB1]GAM24669.1 hypothetical protein SAMD00019534_078440 [Acytostelium subglobosum LB1]|eukprot:XP_012752338.1 hypothetical protein SAMD00019534_078440 [Acytostelium subglobosum LB1]